MQALARLHAGMAAGAHLLSRGEFVHGAWGPTPTRLAQRCPRSLMPLSASAEHRQMRRGPTPDAVAPRLRAPQRLMAVLHTGMAAGAHSNPFVLGSMRARRRSLAHATRNARANALYTASTR